MGSRQMTAEGNAKQLEGICMGNGVVFGNKSPIRKSN